MRKLVYVILATVVVGGLFAIWYSDYTSYSVSSDRLLSRFSDPKEEYAMLLDGQITYQGDTVNFDLLPAEASKLAKKVLNPLF